MEESRRCIRQQHRILNLLPRLALEAARIEPESGASSKLASLRDFGRIGLQGRLP
jgi:hypothetical protein